MKRTAALLAGCAGAIAALSVRHAEKRFHSFGEMMRRAPYVSCRSRCCRHLHTGRSAMRIVV